MQGISVFINIYGVFINIYGGIWSNKIESEGINEEYWNIRCNHNK